MDRTEFETYYYKIDDNNWQRIVYKIFYGDRLDREETNRLLEFLFDARSKIVEKDCDCKCHDGEFAHSPYSDYCCTDAVMDWRD